MRGNSVVELPQQAKSLLASGYGEQVEQIAFIRDGEIADTALRSLVDRQVFLDNSTLLKKPYNSLKAGEDFVGQTLYNALKSIHDNIAGDNPFNFVSRGDCDDLRGQALKSAIYSELQQLSDKYLQERADYIAKASQNLEEAVKNGELEQVSEYLSQGGDPNYSNNILLKLAVESDSEDMSRLLIGHGAKVDWRCAENEENYATRSGDSLLHLAVKREQVDVVKLLLSTNIDKDGVNIAGDTALHFAAYIGNQEIVEILINSGCDQTLQNKAGYRAIDNSLYNSHYAVTRFLADSGNFYEEIIEQDSFLKCRYWSMRLRQSVLSQDLSSAKEDIRKGASVSSILEQEFDRDIEEEIGRTLLALGDVERYKSIRKLVIKDGVAINGVIAEKAQINRELANGDSNKDYKYYSALGLAAKLNSVAMLEVLLDQDVDSRSCNVALEIACKYGKFDVVKFLLEQGVDVNGRGTRSRGFGSNVNIPLDIACRRNYTNIALILIQSNALSSVYEEYIKVHCSYYAAMHYAAYNNNFVIINALVKAGDDINRKSNRCETALSIAITRQHYQLAKRLLQLGARAVSDGADIAKDMTCSEEMRITMLELLFFRGSPPAIVLSRANNQSALRVIKNQLDLDKVLFAKISTGDLSQVQQSISAGGRINGMNSDFNSSLHLAMQYKHKEIAKFLIAKGANLEATNMAGKMPSEIGDDGKQLIQEILDELLISSAANRDIEKIEYYLAAGANVNAIGSNGNSALHFVAFNGLLSAVDILVRYGADVTLGNLSGCKARDLNPDIGVAISNSQEKYKFELSLLSDLQKDEFSSDPNNRVEVSGGRVRRRRVSQGEDGNSNRSDMPSYGEYRDEKGRTILHLAIKAGAKNLTNYMITNYPTLINLSDNQGNVALHYAARNKDISFMTDLLDNGANIHVANHDCYTPEDIARISGNRRCIAIIMADMQKDDNQENSRGLQNSFLRQEQKRQEQSKEAQKADSSFYKY